MVAQYLRRFFKYLVFFVLFIIALLAIVYFTSNHNPDLRFVDLIMPNKQIQFIVFIVVIAAVYPFFGFFKREMPLPRPFAEDKDSITGLFNQLDYELVSDQNEVMTFRPRKTLTRIMRMYEDPILVDYSISDTLKVSGLRKDAYRFARSIEIYLRTPKEQ